MLYLTDNTKIYYVRYWLSIGSNEEPRTWYIKKSIEMLSEICEIEKISAIYESESWGFPSYSFLNLCVRVKSKFPPKSFLALLRKIEVIMGRRASRMYEKIWEKRPIDIDIIFWEGGIYEDEELKIPHPLAHMRKFVLIPLIEMGEDLIHPEIKKRISELLQIIKDETWIIKVAELE